MLYVDTLISIDVMPSAYREEQAAKREGNIVRKAKAKIFNMKGKLFGSYEIHGPR